MSRANQLKHAFICPVLLVFCVLASYPRLEMGINDDWAYIWSAHVLADTGHIVYNGWETTMLGWQLYFGAWFIKIFGFSFAALRSSILLISLLTCMLLQRLFVRLGISEWNSSVATGTIVLSPLFLLLGYSFMSDVPGLFVLVLCILACVRAVQADTDAGSLWWLLFASFSNIVGGSVRQIAWLGVLVVVPCTAWILRRRKGMIVTATIQWILSVVAILLLTRWFEAQPYTISEPLLSKSPAMPHDVQPAMNILCAVLEIGLLVLPLTSAFLVRYPEFSKCRRAFASFTGIVSVGMLMVGTRHHSVFALLPFTGPYLTAKGVSIPGVLGVQPTIIGAPLRVVVMLPVVTSLLCFLALLPSGRGWSGERRPMRSEGELKNIASGDLIFMLGPLGVVLIALLVTRSALFDRYFLPLLVLLAIVILRVFEVRIGGRLPILSTTLVGLFALYGIASVHDLYALDRARLAAANEIRATGVPRTQIRGGFEYDGTTQLAIAGFVNESRIKKPVGAYRPILPNYTDPCVSWFSDRTPAIQARYVLARDATCFGPSRFQPVAYRTWLPWRKQFVLIRKVPER